MTGYLKWLIAQAAGSTTTVRPRHRPRLYAPLDTRRDQTEPAEAHRPEQATGIPLPLSQLQEKSTSAEHKPEARAIENARKVQPNVSSPLVTRTRGPDFEPPATQLQSDVSMPQAQSHQRATSLHETVRKLVTAVPVTVAPPDPVVTQTQTAIPRSLASIEEPKRASEDWMLRTHSRANTSDVAHISTRDDKPLAEATIVTNIRIGRVELTAVTKPPLPRKVTSAPVKAPMSLEEYLRRRSGKSQ